MIRSRLKQSPLRAFLLLVGIPIFAATFLFCWDRSHAKSYILWCLTIGMSKSQAENAIRNSLNESAEKLLLPQALQEFAKLRAEGVQLVFATASCRLWLEPLLRQAGIAEEAFVGTRWTWRWGGLQIEGKNCLGSEKIVELMKIFSGIEKGAWDCRCGYSDSFADQPLLSLCAQKFLISPTPDHLLKYKAQWKECVVLPWRG